MGKPSSGGFEKKNVYVSPVHNQGENLRKQSEAIAEATKEASKRDIAERLVDELKPQIVSIVERAFRRYTKAHGVPKEQEDLEWTRFKKILSRML